MNSPKHILDQLESDISIDHDLKTQVRARINSSPSSRKPWALILAPTFAGAFVLAVIFSPIQWKSLYQQFTSPTPSSETPISFSFLQEVRAAYEEKAISSSLIQDAVRHIQTKHINEYGTISLLDVWMSLNGGKYFDQVTDSQGDSLSHDWLQVNGNMYTTAEQVAIENEAFRFAQSHDEISASHYNISTPIDVISARMMIGVDNIICYDYEFMDDAARKASVAAQEIMKLTDVSSQTNFSDTVRLINNLEASGELEDLGISSDPELGSLHGYRIAYTYQVPAITKLTSAPVTETFMGEYYFATETYQLKKISYRPWGRRNILNLHYHD